MRVAAIEWCYHIPNLQVYLFRRIYDDLIKNQTPARLRSYTAARPVAANRISCV
jgi:hypothetical protein